MNKNNGTGFWQYILLSVITIFITVFAGQEIKAQSDAILPDEVLVKLNSPANLPAISSQYGLLLVDQFGSRPIYRLKIVNGNSVNNTVRNLQKDTRVVYADANSLVASPEASGLSWSIGLSWSVGETVVAYNEQWFPNLIRLSQANQISTGENVKVAVLDTGINYNHSEFAGKILPGWDFVDNDPDPMEVGIIGFGPYGHGTHVTGIITRVAPDAKIMPIRVLDHTGRTNVWILAEALAFAANPDGNPATDDGADIVNLSLGTPVQTRLLHDLIQTSASGLEEPTDDDFPQIGKPNLMVIAAGGNNGRETKIYPGAETSIDGLITVAASDNRDRLARYSNFGSWIKVAAPGDQIVSTTVDGGYGTWSGTSMAAPIVSGITALINQKFPGLTGGQIREHIRCTSVRINSQRTNERVDAYNAVTIEPNTGRCAED